MTEFEVRALAKEPYRAVVERLHRIAAGDDAALQDLLGQVRTALADAALQRRNARSSQLRFWSDWLETGPAADGRAASKLAEIAIASLCLPDFQLHPLAGEPAASTLVILGDSDGGLFGVLTEKIPWFEPWLIEGLARRAERFGYGRNMFRLTDQGLSLWVQSLPSNDDCRGASQPEHCQATLAWLSALLATARGRPDWDIAIAEGG